MKRDYLAVLFVAGVVILASQTGALAHTDVTPEQARELIESTDGLLVVDVRERSEYCDARGHIPGALNYPLTSGVLQDHYEELPLDRPILVVCRSGGRSNQAANFLDDQGFGEVYDMTGGMNAWLWETAPCKYAGGSGTATDPYQIATAEQMNAIGADPNDWDKHFILTADIDLSGYEYHRALIAPDTDDKLRFQGTSFTGVFDGNGHVIANFRVISSDADYVGLFGCVSHPDAEITNLGLVDPNVAAGGALGAGALIGRLALGRVQNCFVEGGTVSAEGYLGGLVGEASFGTIADCYVTANVSGQLDVGCLVGRNAVDLRNCYATGDVVGDRNAGGLVGFTVHHRGSITNCHATGQVTGETCVGGLVGRAGGGVVADCFAEGAVNGNSNVGGLVGLNEEGITNCYASGGVVAFDFGGGLVGTNWRMIQNCHATGSVTGSTDVGGLVGHNGGTITASSSTGRVSADDGSVGGLVGDNWGQVTACSSNGTVRGEERVGGLVGDNWGHIAMSYSSGPVTGGEDTGGLVGLGAYPITAGFWDIETSGQATSGGGTGLTTTQMQEMAVFLSRGWDFVDESLNGTCDYWQMSPGEYPRLRYLTGDGPEMPEGLGTPEAPYLIRDARDLGSVWFEPLAHYRLEASVDLADVTWCVAPIPWFEGSLDGDGYVISRLYIQGSADLGLFGRLAYSADISHLGLEAVDVNGAGAYVGGLAGSNRGRIRTSYCTGTVSGGDAVGGLVGWSDGREVEYCHSSAAVSGDTSVGGLLGWNTGHARDCYATGSVSGMQYVGGLVGQNGGRRGGEDGSIAYSHVWHCYATGSLWGTEDVGGLIGICWQGSRSHGCFWDTQSSLLATSGGTETGVTTAEMQVAETFLEAGWDFVGETENGEGEIWWIEEGVDYPRLWWERPEGEF